MPCLSDLSTTLRAGRLMPAARVEVAVRASTAPHRYAASTTLRSPAARPWGNWGEGGRGRGGEEGGEGKGGKRRGREGGKGLERQCRCGRAV